MEVIAGKRNTVHHLLNYKKGSYIFLIGKFKHFQVPYFHTHTNPCICHFILTDVYFTFHSQIA